MSRASSRRVSCAPSLAHSPYPTPPAAYLFLTEGVVDRSDQSGHGPSFLRHAARINAAAGTRITVYHNFHDEVDVHRTHIWQCQVRAGRRGGSVAVLARSSHAHERTSARTSRCRRR